MEDVYEALLFFDDLPPEQQEELRAQMEQDEELADAFAHWQRVRAALRERLDDAVPDRRLLVLYALEQSDAADLLTEAERTELEAGREAIHDALEAVPALSTVIEQIQAEQAEFETAWAESDLAVDAEPHTESVDAIDREARADRSARQSSAARGERGSIFRRLAAGALVVAATVLVVFIWPRDTEMRTVTTAVGEMQEVALVDGSTVRLAGNSEIAFKQVTSESFDRRVELRYGRAFFDVQSLKSNTPFVVETPTARATVLGTQFGVTTGTDTTEVVLASGKVEVNSSDGPSESAVVLTPGEHSRVVRDQSPTAAEPVNLAAALDWSGFFVFRNTPAQSMAERLSAHYGTPVTVTAPLQDEGVTGTFDRSQSLENILEAFASTLDARLTGSSDSGYTLAPQTE